MPQRSRCSPVHPAFEWNCNMKSFRPLRRSLLAVMASLALAGTVHAQQAPSVPPRLPNAGQLLQQVPRQPETAPSSDLDLRMLHVQRRPVHDARSFLVRKIRIVGNTLLPTSTLHALVADSEGHRLTLGELQTLAERIGDAYHAAGYPLARAYVPAQTLHDGAVQIDVVEARYGEVVLQNHSSVSDKTLRKVLEPLQAGQPVANRSLERSLLLLSDVPGATTSSVMRPGDKPGTSDLVVDASAAPRYTGTIGVDDFGNRYTGRARVSGSFDINGPLHRGDLLQFGATSSGSGMSYFQGGYRMFLNGQGTTLRAGVSTLHYHLRNGLEALDAHGSALVGSLTLAHPFIRSTAGNLYVQIEFDRKLLKDDIEAALLHNDRHLDVWSATLAGDQRDAHGVTNFQLGISHGKVEFTDTLAEVIDQLTARTAEGYSRYVVSVSRLQQLDPASAIYVGYSRQWASKNLDTSAQFFLGGPDTVRGYGVGALSGSQGNLFTAEFRHDLHLPGMRGRWQATLFADTGRVEVYKDPFIGGVNSGRASSAGVGLHWATPGEWFVDVSASGPIGATPALLQPAGAGTQWWVQIRKGFY
jgi:hemolysin activation/secretion protein